jgi:hypothetical protein
LLFEARSGLAEEKAEDANKGKGEEKRLTAEVAEKGCGGRGDLTAKVAKEQPQRSRRRAAEDAEI